MTSITIPELAVVVLIGPSGSGKTTFARKHFLPTEVLSADFFRGLVSDDENDQGATKEAFEVLHFVAGKRLTAGRLVVIDATNVQQEARKPLIALAREQNILAVAIVLDLPEKLCRERNRDRTDRNFGAYVLRQQCQQLRRSVQRLKREGFRYIYTLKTPEEVDAAQVERARLWTNKRNEHGPFDVIGDVHGCFAELRELLESLGYGVTEKMGEDGQPIYAVQCPADRTVIFLGDLVDRGPDVVSVLRLVMGMVQSGSALCVPGNHDVKLLRKLWGKNVQLTHGLAETLEQLEAESEEFRNEVAKFLDSLISHYVLDDGKLVVAHAGMRAEYQGRASGRVREFALYGDTTGETDEFGLPVRYPWATDYRGEARVIYGHTPVPEPEWLNRTMNIDTGCAFGGKLTALRYPELELVSIPAKATYCEPAKPFLPEGQEAPTLSAQQQHDDVLDIDDVIGKRFVSTRLRKNITIREENAIAALEVMTRFAINPKWLIYLPPTMSPCETSKLPEYLEHPAEAFSYFRKQGVSQVVCEEKHMGSRAIVIVCRDEAVALKNFGVEDEVIGVCYTRTGRRFFDDTDLERTFLDKVAAAVGAAGIWEELSTDWICLDCELMPWSAKAQELLRRQYAAAGSAGSAATASALEVLRQAKDRGLPVDSLVERTAARADMIADYIQAYRQYCWPVKSVRDLKLAPFHIMATEGRIYTDRDHTWHMDTLGRICAAANDLLIATPYRIVDVTSPESEQEGTSWWEGLTADGGEGMVVKPLDFLAWGKRGLVQPAIKCRGREYLRIVYGPEYTAPEHMERLRGRSLGRKRSLAVSEFALGIEGLERFVRKEPLRRVHECVFGVLALESEPVDPRL